MPNFLVIESFILSNSFRDTVREGLLQTHGEGGGQPKCHVTIFGPF